MENGGAARQVSLDMLPGIELPGNKVTASNFYSWPWPCFEVFCSSSLKMPRDFNPQIGSNTIKVNFSAEFTL